MAPFSFRQQETYAPSIILYRNVKFNSYGEGRVYEEVYYYKNSQVFWIKETDEVLTWQVL